MNFQLISDLHLEHYRDVRDIWKNLTPSSENLLIAGDICAYNLYEALTEIASRYKQVVCVLGNHDYYNRHVGFNTCWVPSVPENVTVLEQSCVELDGVLIAGGTLWTDFKNEDWFVKHNSSKNVEDFTAIPQFTPAKAIHRFRRTVDYLKHVVQQNRGKKLVIMTHFVPSYSLIGERWKHASYEMLSRYFSGSCDELISICDPGTIWVYGHTHDASSQVLNDVQFYVNPLGYRKSLKWTSYQNLVIEL